MDGSSTHSPLPARLVFQTPSKRCPFRHWNGSEVEILREGRLTYVRRARAHLRIYLVGVPNPPPAGYSAKFAVYADELFIEKGESE